MDFPGCLHAFNLFVRVSSVIIRPITMIFSLSKYLIGDWEWYCQRWNHSVSTAVVFLPGDVNEFPSITGQVQFNCSRTNVGLVLITFTTDSTISCSVIMKARVLTRKENKLKLFFHYREYNRPPWLLGWQSRVRISSTWWNFLGHKRQPWSYTQGFWTAMYVTQYHYKTVPQNSYFAGLMIVLLRLGWMFK